jgi:hypothetical protein
MAINIPNSFTSRTPALAAEVNENFTEVANTALDKTGDTITGNVSVSAGITIDGIDISAVLPASGQVVFPASQNASSNANTLDDYEEGTFVPVVTFGGGSTGMTFSDQQGAYVKIGQFVLVYVRFIFTAKGSSTGAAVVTLPFQASSGAYGGVFAPFCSGMSSVGGGVMGYTIPNTSTIQLTTNGATGIVNLTDTNFGNATDLILTGSYRASA